MQRKENTFVQLCLSYYLGNVMAFPRVQAITENQGPYIWGDPDPHPKYLQRDIFLCHLGSAAGVTVKNEVCLTVLILPWLDHVCRPLASSCSKNKDCRMSCSNWMEIHKRKCMLWDRSATLVAMCFADHLRQVLILGEP